MPQFNMHNELNKFYEDHLQLKDEINRLRGLRDTNLTRLTEGLKELKHPNFVNNLLQGSIAMHTANKSSNNDYDIDIAAIFEKSDLPASPLEARKRVAEAIKLKANGFSQDPEARTNAVTIWYAAGYHVDIAVYGRSKDWLGNEILEHAGVAWTKRDPKTVTNWFTGEVSRQSPSKDLLTTPLVAPQQMRRIVRWLKVFAKAREGWNLPGGFIISALVAECYQPHNDRDDIALYDTLKKIKSRLDGSLKVYNPVDTSQELTDKPKFITQVKNLKKRFGSALSKLDILFDEKCTEVNARKAWNYLFQHNYWTQTDNNAPDEDQKSQAYNLQLSMGIAKSQGGYIKSQNIRSGTFLPKRLHIRFEATTNVPSPFTVKWRAVNSGDEAEAANDMGHIATSDNLTHWERTTYRGKHEMICEILIAGEVIATAKHVVNIR